MRHLAPMMLVVALVACATQTPASKLDAPVAAVTAPPPIKPMPPGLDESVMDLTANPCTDFYQYACGGWLQRTEIPADRALYSRGFIAIAERNEQVMKAICDDAVAGKLGDLPFADKLRDYYGSCMDEAKLDAGLADLKAWLKPLASPKNPAALAKAVAAFHQAGYNPLFSVGSMQDLKDSTLMVGSFEQSGLGLPDRDYYTKDDEKTVAVRNAYAAHVEKMFGLYGEKPEAAKAAAATIMRLETRLAKAQLTRVEQRDPQALYHRLERAGLKQAAPAFPWDAYFEAVGHKSMTAINVASPKYLAELGAAVKDEKSATWATYLTWAALRAAVPGLPKAFQDEAFAYTAKALTGATEDRPRWKKCVAWADQDLGEVLGREFARRNFGEGSKKTTNAMVVALSAAVKADLATLTWMDDATRAQALTKLERMTGNNKIGYPDEWRDYAALKVGPGSFLANRMAGQRHAFERRLNQVGKPVDRKEWLMTTPTVNAYNEGQKNEIVFPAGILQPPFFNPAATDAVNFGSMGMVVGHEITHGFDDEGSQFDVDGNMKNWWSELAKKSFTEKTECVKKQFDAYVAIDDIHLNGALTLGENTADLGGLKLAYAAMEQWLAKAPLAGDYRFTAGQQFFLGYAQSWCTKVRPEQARVRAATDPHSPPKFRVNGPLGNVEAFRQAFACPAGAPMLRSGEQRCEVW